MKWSGLCRLLAVLLIVVWSLLLFDAVRVVERQSKIDAAIIISDAFVARPTNVDTSSNRGAVVEKNHIKNSQTTISEFTAKTPESALRKAIRRWRPYPRVERFPLEGTEQFQTECGWTMSDSKNEHSFPCTFFVRPSPKTSEGVADWIGRVVSGYLLAKQTGCQLIYDYGPQVNMSQVLLPSSDPQATWRLPPDFICSESSDRRPCFESGTATQGLDFGKDEAIVSIAARVNQTVLPVPFYRFIGTMRGRNFSELERTLPGFTLRNGMGCALSRLFRFAPSAALIEPRLFDMLHTLRQQESLVLSLYIRTFHSDHIVYNRSATDDMEKSMELANASITCAFKIEKEYVKNKQARNVTWLLLTDSPELKKRIEEDYSQGSIRLGEKMVSRHVLVTSSRGRHTKGFLRPSTAVFAEALFDWHLIGESDVVVTSSSITYGVSAAGRTGRPTFRTGKNETNWEVVVADSTFSAPHRRDRSDRFA